jgi:dual specificity MAP kinase phosphatase
MAALKVQACGLDDLFRVFSACKGDNPVLLLDVRPAKEFAKAHLRHAFNVRCSANGAVLLDYSRAAYTHHVWSDACWWGKDCLLYGPPGLAHDHPVAAFLAREGCARSVRVLPDGFAAAAAALPFLCTSSVKSNPAKPFPSRLEPHLYLGDWEHAAAGAQLAELGVRSVLTIHNNPERLALPAGVRRMQIQMADVESEELGPWLRQAHAFIEAGREAGHGAPPPCPACPPAGAAALPGRRAHVRAMRGMRDMAALAD